MYTKINEVQVDIKSDEDFHPAKKSELSFNDTVFWTTFRQSKQSSAGQNQTIVNILRFATDSNFTSSVCAVDCI